MSFLPKSGKLRALVSIGHKLIPKTSWFWENLIQYDIPARLDQLTCTAFHKGQCFNATSSNTSMGAFCGT